MTHRLFIPDSANVIADPTSTNMNADLSARLCQAPWLTRRILLIERSDVDRGWYVSYEE